ncbi:MAG: alpha-L-arabinofuranosidase, partial [Bacteroidia bacterium]
MKAKFSIVLTLFILVSCQQNQVGPGYGIIKNPSAEDVESSVVSGWTPERGNRVATHFYDNEAHHGSKSLTVFSDRQANGRWSAKVLLKPWSTYRFSGWIKTDNLVPLNGRGAGFRLDGFDVEPVSFTGTNEWTLVEYEFNTGNDDSMVISCLFGIDGPSTGRAWFDDMNLELVASEKLEPSVIIDVSSESEPMPVYIYGQFIEHLGRCIYGGIWAEMLEDRKFWYTPGTRESPWRLEGDRSMLTIETSDPFTGTQAPCLKSDGNASAILVQENLGLKKDLDYVGRIILKATAGLEKAVVVLSWDDTEQVVEITNLTQEYNTYPLKYHSGREVGDASIKIFPTGKGSLWVGTLSLMPSDNIEGFRSDVLQLLRELDSPVYRWPGGNFVSGYNWKDGLGDRDRRPPRKNPAWTGIESNDVGIDEFMKFCELLGTEPYIAVNAGLGNASQAREEVEYTNGDVTTPMGRLRSSYGNPEPWKVKWWSIGNEMYGSWQLGYMTTEQFVEKHNEFADEMRSADPEITLIAVGDVGRWDKMILANCADNMDYISEHFYVQDWHGGGLMTHVKQVPDAIRSKAVAHREYRETIPSLADKDIRICMDEWNYWYGPHIYGELGVRYFYRDAMGIAAGLNEFSRNTDIIYMANYAQTVNVIGAIKT